MRQIYEANNDTGVTRRRAQKDKQPPWVKVPIWWLDLVVKAVDSPQQVFVAVWLLKLHFEHRRLTFPLPNGRLGRQGFDRRVKWHALENLEKAGLIVIERRPGKSPIVSLVVV
jgi:hypothetical protein